MATINTNMAANIASNSLTRNERSMSATMERLSTGLRINSAKDDAAGLAISSKMTSQINGLNQAVRNANDAVSMVQVAEGAMKEVTNMFQRMRELAIQAISDSNTSNDRIALNNEYKQLSFEVSRIAENTQWNGTNILDGARTATVFQVGANASQTITVNFGDLSAGNTATMGTISAHSGGSTKANGSLTISGSVSKDDVITFKTDVVDSTAPGTNTGTYKQVTLTQTQADAINNGTTSMTAIDIANAITANSNDKISLTVTAAGTLKVEGNTAANGETFSISEVTVTRGLHSPLAATDITTSSQADSALGVLDTAISNVNDNRAVLGASMSRLEFASDNLQNVAQNTSAARSRVLDADYASETTELARTQIIQQAGTAMLSQANQSQQAVLSLLNFS
jgi:flagellin